MPAASGAALAGAQWLIPVNNYLGILYAREALKLVSIFHVIIS